MGRIARSPRKRQALPRRMMMAAAALILGGGGLVAVNFYASASEGDSGGSGSSGHDMAQMRMLSTIDCPDVGNSLSTVPDSAKSRVDRRLADLDTQITDAYTKFADNKDRIQRDPRLADTMVLNPLKRQRTDSIGEIADATGQPDLNDKGLAACTMRAADVQASNDQGGNQVDAQGNGQNAADNVTASGPARSDFVDIRSVRPNVAAPQPGRGASTGTFTSDCGRNQNGKRNPDNVIVAPGVSNGAHHMHDYVGNQATDAFSSDADLARGNTSCRNQGDKSTYYWPVVRVLNQGNDTDARADGGGKDKNVGKIQTPVQATIQLAGSPVSKVTAMPRFLRIITGDAKAFTNGNANANASWSCTGFENRQLKDKYPLCPQGSKVVRTFKFQSCWDGRNTDSANHRTHVAFADKRGACPAGFKAIPQLVQRIVYDVPAKAGAFAVDSFPEQLHKPVTDHGDFIDVFSDQLMGKAVNCINTGRSCA
ncbi:hypothetical protein GCM10010289_12880 [Streptomyces violascens]|uniref:DUF1996 domain-containing protein n=3 Tax=Streptomyces violascens TaxID=67381 RepID=A0ABQ3QK78_9ACTN|nr:DUF1996 domain-containing protein [Streptomyces violascens]GGT94200.1 hypothetical protein GCM10010289_12880 [Streptomyces violascens]GHI37662.1 hypothetical protein Sviol_20700 [Streptomyces violascens]